MSTTLARTIPAYMQDLAKCVRALRHYHGHTQVELARKTGLSPATLNRVEKAHVVSMTLEHFMALADFFNVKPNVLLGQDPLCLEPHASEDEDALDQ